MTSWLYTVLYYIIYCLCVYDVYLRFTYTCFLDVRMYMHMCFCVYVSYIHTCVYTWCLCLLCLACIHVGELFSGLGNLDFHLL